MVEETGVPGGNHQYVICAENPFERWSEGGETERDGVREGGVGSVYHALYASGALESGMAHTIYPCVSSMGHDFKSHS
jgi:hypothetical protein